MFRSPTMLLALLALIVIAGAIWYTASQTRSDNDRADTEVAVGTAPREVPVDRGVYDEAAPAPEDDAPLAPRGDVEPPLEPPAPLEDPSLGGPTEVASAATPDPVEPESPGGGTSALATARAFYSALSGGDGASAAQWVVPAKRQSGPLSAGELSRYYSSLRRPLRVRSLTPVDANTVRVAYDYVLADGRPCRGQAVVNVVQSGDRSLVSGIRAQGPC